MGSNEIKYWGYFNEYIIICIRDGRALARRPDRQARTFGNGAKGGGARGPEGGCPVPEEGPGGGGPGPRCSPRDRVLAGVGPAGPGP